MMLWCLFLSSQSKAKTHTHQQKGNKIEKGLLALSQFSQLFQYPSHFHIHRPFHYINVYLIYFFSIGIAYN